MEDTVKRCDDVDVAFDRKLDKNDYKRTMKTKLDAEVFLRVFPAHVPPIEILKGMIQKENQAFNAQVMNMVKLWDQKITNLRSELNISGLYTKLKKFSIKEEVQEKFDQLLIDQQKMQNILVTFDHRLEKTQGMREDIELKL